MKFTNLFRKCFISGTVEPFASVAGLVLRVVLCCAMGTHGFAKLSGFRELWTTFPDPLGIGSAPSLLLAIFAEVLCSLAIAVGLLTRLSLIPLMTTMCVAFFIVHARDPFAVKELALLYLVAYVALFLWGPGRISVDHFLCRYFDRIPWNKFFKRRTDGTSGQQTP